jgi:autotransporter family porin
MAQQNILPGRAPIVWSTVDNAFQQINANFTELYLSIGGTGVDLNNIAASLIPDSNSVRDLGSATRRWKDIYLSGSSIYLGPAVITANLSGHVNLPIGSTVGGALIRNPDESSFKTVRVAGQDDVVANNFEGILNLTGNGISISTNASSDTITLTNSGVTSISQGSGVSISNSTGAVTISNTGVLTATSVGNGIAIGGTSSNITIANTGVTQLIADTGIVLSNTVGSITITNSSPNITQNVYRFISVTGSPTLDPSGPTSTLNINTSGDGLSITANAISNTVTFFNTGVTSLAVDSGLTINSGTGSVLLGISQTLERNLQGDVTGSVFADNSTMLVDGSNGKIVGPVSIDITNLSVFGGAPGDTILTDGLGNLTFGVAANIGNIIFSGNTVDSNDSASITFVPSVTFNSDANIENELTVRTNATVSGMLSVNNLNVSGTITSQGSGSPELFSDNEIFLTAGTRVEISNSPLKMASFTTSGRDALSAINGDVIYNTSLNKFQGYANGIWIDFH